MVGQTGGVAGFGNIEYSFDHELVVDGDLVSAVVGS